ncbi:MAG TPA: hypothetical protein VMU61_11500 [Candidatus Aquilonibacter sp.]|nr:hypothetical protein [Candidatus Aquilonibacter sp.]
MSSLPQLHQQWRPPRARLESNTPAVLRFPNGQRTWAKLQVISVTGGLLSVSQPVVQGSQVKVMFLTAGGTVLGGAEMLRPVSKALQPFRFVSIAADDQRRLGALILERSRPSKAEQDWIEKLRAASAQNAAPRPWRFKLAGAVGLLTVGLGTAAYLLHFSLLK